MSSNEEPQVDLVKYDIKPTDDFKYYMSPEIYYITVTNRMKGFVCGLKEARDLLREHKDVPEIKLIIGKLSGLIAGVDNTGGWQ